MYVETAGVYRIVFHRSEKNGLEAENDERKRHDEGLHNPGYTTSSILPDNLCVCAWGSAECLEYECEVEGYGGGGQEEEKGLLEAQTTSGYRVQNTEPRDDDGGEEDGDERVEEVGVLRRIPPHFQNHDPKDDLCEQ